MLVEIPFELKTSELNLYDQIIEAVVFSLAATRDIDGPDSA